MQDAIRMLQEQQAKARLIVVFDESHKIVARHMNACDVMVLASDDEGAPMAIRDAMACNLPIVSVDVGDVRQIIGDIEGCYLCKREAADLAEKLGWALDREETTDWARVVRRMDVVRSVEQVLRVYKLVLSGDQSWRYVYENSDRRLW